MRTIILIALCTAAACGSKKDPGSQGSGTGGSAAPTPVEKVRPSQDPQPPLPPLDLPADPKRAEKVALGNALFFDTKMSGHNDRSCYSCHLNEDGTGGHDPLPKGSGDVQITRHPPTMWNVGYWKGALYWDGRSPTLEAQAKGAWGGPNMGAGDKDDKKNIEMLDKKAAELAALPEYKKLFEAAFPGTTPIKAEHVQSALAEYMRTLVCNDTAYDAYAAGNKKALDESQQRGLDVFLGKGGCTVCHAAPYFSTAMAQAGGAYYNVGIGTQGVAEDKVDIGRAKISKNNEDWAAFKVPSLRNIAKSPPYFHDGSVARLEDAVKLMASGGLPNKNKNPLLVDKKLTDAELADLVAFLRGLDCKGTLKPPAEAASTGTGSGGGSGGGSGSDAGTGSGSAAGSASTGSGSAAGSGSAKPAGSGSAKK